MHLQPHRNSLKNKHRREHARIHLTWRLTDFRIMSLSLQIPPPPGRIEEGLERNAWMDINIREGKGVSLSHSTPLTILCLLNVTAGLWNEPFCLLPYTELLNQAGVLQTQEHSLRQNIWTGQARAQPHVLYWRPAPLSPRHEDLPSGASE